MSSLLPPEEEARRRELHKQVFDDGAIAEAVGRSRAAITCWRWTRKLKPNRPPYRSRKPKERPKTQRSVIIHNPDLNKQFIEAFERDLVYAANRSKTKKPDVTAFIKIWRRVRAHEVLREIEEVPE